MYAFSLRAAAFFVCAFFLLNRTFLPFSLLPSAIVCDRRVKEENLPANLVVIAACNPYRKSVSTSTAGLVYQYADAAASQEELKQLAYMVHPLPEIMKQYVWDFGSLTSQAEEQYIDRLLARCSVKQFPQAYRGFCRAVHNSHEFVKENEKELHGMVSLRDVLRCCSLYEWFMEYLRENRHAPHSDVTSARAITLTLAICYYFRLTYVGVLALLRATAHELLIPLRACVVQENTPNQVRQQAGKRLQQRRPLRVRVAGREHVDSRQHGAAARHGQEPSPARERVRAAGVHLQQDPCLRTCLPLRILRQFRVLN